MFCRYFKYEQRDADIVLEALVRKTEVIQKQLGSAGQVIEQRIKDRLASIGIDRGQAQALAKAIEDETDADPPSPCVDHRRGRSHIGRGRGRPRGGGRRLLLERDGRTNDAILDRLDQ